MKISKAEHIEGLIQQITVKSAAAAGIYTWLDSKNASRSCLKPNLCLMVLFLRYVEVSYCLS